MRDIYGFMPRARSPDAAHPPAFADVFEDGFAPTRDRRGDLAERREGKRVLTEVKYCEEARSRGARADLIRPGPW
jgi:hypothetical protein